MTNGLPWQLPVVPHIFFEAICGMISSNTRVTLGIERVVHVEYLAMRMDVEWRHRANVIPAYAGIQSPGTPWIPAYAGMTITLGYNMSVSKVHNTL